ncbi:alcohol dehydrogenase 2 [Phyllosticta capitalensis]|uniref:Chaperonin 10-like protein n=1 Tax=Phyllosticta capitalensis TaxID=121624 RepID=A0ABR1Z4U0_9PEZI
MAAAPELPKKYKAIVFDKPGSHSTKLVELDMPEPGPGEVLINLSCSGVCASDHGVMMSSWANLPYPTPENQVGGHEGVGRVVKLGPGSAEMSTVKVGDRVGIKWISAICDSCPACRAGHDGVCFNQKISGYYTPGTFQQYVLGPANYVTKIPDGLSDTDAAPMLCAGVTTYSALRKSNALSGEFVVLLGAGGGLGNVAAQIASKGMALRVIGVDADAKESFALSSGCEAFVPLSLGDKIPDRVRELTGGMGAHAVIVLTGSNAAYAQAIDMLRFGGTLVCVGVPVNEPVTIASAFPQFLIKFAKKIVGVPVGNRKDADEVMEFAARGIVKSNYRVEKMDKLSDVFEEMEAGTLQGRVVLDLS